MPQSAATAHPSIPSIAARHTAFRVGSGAILLSEYNRSLMSDQFVLRLAQLSDFAFCQRLYFEGMGSIIETLKLDMARQRESFGQQWRLAEQRYASLQSRATMSAGCKPRGRTMPSFSGSFI